MSFKNMQVSPASDCGCDDDFYGDCKDNKCVCRILRKIAKVQAVSDSPSDCEYGCKQSIQDFVRPARSVLEYDTIPFILYCKGCDPFIGQSVVQATVAGERVFQCFESPIFRINKVKDDCCAEIELLLPVTGEGTAPGGGDDVCSFFPANTIEDLQRTGICITVDLCDFTSVACLEPVETLPVSNFRQSLQNGNNAGAARANR